MFFLDSPQFCPSIQSGMSLLTAKNCSGCWERPSCVSDADLDATGASWTASAQMSHPATKVGPQIPLPGWSRWMNLDEPTGWSFTTPKFKFWLFLVGKQAKWGYLTFSLLLKPLDSCIHPPPLPQALIVCFWLETIFTHLQPNQPADRNSFNTSEYNYLTVWFTLF